MDSVVLCLNFPGFAKVPGRRLLSPERFLLTLLAKMSNKELAEKTRKALEEYNKLPSEEQVKRLVSLGTIDKNGLVLMGTDGEIKKRIAQTREEG